MPPLPIDFIDESLLYKTIGILDIGNTLNALMYGITTVQVYNYLRRYWTRGDSTLMKSVILVLWMLNTLEMAVYLAGVFYYSVINFMNPLALYSPTWYILAYLLLGLIADCMVTMIYATRLWKLGNMMYPVSLITLMVLLSLGAGIAFFILGLNHTYAEISRYSWLWYLTFGSELVADVTISISLCITLHRRRTGIHRTDSVIRVLMIYSINTCALASVMRGASMVAYAVGQDTYTVLLVSSLQPRIIFASVMAYLNSRQSMRETYTNELVSIHLSRLPSAPSGSLDPRTKEGGSDAIVAHTKLDNMTEHIYVSAQNGGPQT